MSSRFAFWSAASLLVGVVLVRAFPFVWSATTHFDSDQAIVGLMAKHISEGRAFPLYYYGQNYMLAVEAYLAAPVMLVAGPSVTALKTPLVVVNLAVVLLLFCVLVREARLHAWAAVLAVLPLAMPAAGVAARVTEANGGNVEPWLYVLLVWVTRRHPWLLGLVLGIGMLHREFTAYGAAALLLMETIRIATSTSPAATAADAARRWAMTGLVWVAVRSLAAAVQPFANGLGPGSRGDDPTLAATVVDTLGGRLCLDPPAWPDRGAALIGDHLPRLFGGMPAPLREYGVLTGVYSGQQGVGPWVAALTLMGVVGGLWHWRTTRGRHRGDTAASSHIGGYLMLVGVISTLVYGFATCSDIRVETLRYNLLGVMVPVGAIVMALEAWRSPTVRAGLGAAVVLWCAVNASDVLALARQTLVAPFPDTRQALADALERRGIQAAWSRYGTAYHVTFLAGERVRVSASDFARITSYFDEATRTGAPTVSGTPCENGELLLPGVYLCR